MRTVNGQYEEIGIKWPFPWPEMSTLRPQISLWPSYLLNSISEKIKVHFLFQNFAYSIQLYTVYMFFYQLKSWLKTQLTLILAKLHEQPIQACCLFSFSGISVYGVFLSAFRCMEKNISFFLTGDLQITFLRNKSSWPKMTGNYWAIKLCARPLMHRGGIWFIKKKKEVV